MVPSIQGSSLVGEIYRYQVTGPPHFGLTNLRTIQDWIVQRRLLTVEGVVQVNTWGGTTKEFEVEVDLHKLDAYNVTLPQVISAISNANINVGGRTLIFGQQSVNIRGIGLMDSGGNDDLTKGYRVRDIENVVLAQFNGVPVKVKDVGSVYVGNVPRLGKAGRDAENDVVAAIVVMNRTLHTNDVAPRIKKEIEKINTDGTLPPGVKLVPFYDRTTLVSVTTKTVLHNLMFGCILVFLIQWIFLGNLRSAIIVGVNIPFALFFSIVILVLRGEDANLLSVGAVDFGIIVDSAVILVENIYRNFQANPAERQRDARRTTSTAGPRPWPERLRTIYSSALQVDKAVFFSTAVTIAAFIPLFTMQGVEGQIFNPMARTYGYALIGALLATFTVTPVLASYMLPEHVEEAETIVVRALRCDVYADPAMVIIAPGRHGRDRGGLHRGVRLRRDAAGHGVPARAGRRQSLDQSVDAADDIARSRHGRFVDRIRAILLTYPEVITVVSQHGRPDNGSDAAGFNNAEFFVPLKPFDEWPPNVTKEKLVDGIAK